ncbi:MAG: sirohydrochlorin chelatase [Pseudomonadota bacterium]
MERRMNRLRRSATVLTLVVLLQAELAGTAAARGVEPGAHHRGQEVGFLVVAPDRGFAGNEETREAFDAFAAGRNAALAFVTDERTGDNLRAALQRLVEGGAGRAVALPLFISKTDPRYVLAAKLLGAGVEKSAEDLKTGPPAMPAIPMPVSFARAFGETYLAVEMLADRFRAVREPGGRRVVVVGYGARDADSRKGMEADWRRIAEHAAKGFGFESVRVVVWHDRAAPDKAQAGQSLAEAAIGGDRVIVVPFHFGRKLDGMMSFDAELKRVLPAEAELLEAAAEPHPAVAAWMSRDANRHLTLRPQDIGVVLLAHGADYHWNETMRQAVRPLADRYKVEFVFSMADQQLIERAVRRLERRGSRAIVIVRVFGLASAFRDAIERMIGLDVEQGLPDGAANAVTQPESHGHEHGGSGHGHAHAHDSGPLAGGPPARIRAAVPITSVGGLEADPLFATALLDRARALSREPERETVILVAHGSGDDGKNEHWLGTLEKLAARMRANGGEGFRAIRFATWREDWPDKRAPWVSAVREMVREATSEGGRAIVIPARTNAQGPEREFLAGLDFALGEGFAPHPLFVRWVDKQVRQGIAEIAAADGRGAALAAH